MSATKHRQTSRLEHTFAIPLEEVLALLPATARESLQGWDFDCYVGRRDGAEGDDDVLLATFTQQRFFKADASGKMAEEPKIERDRCARKGEVQEMIAAAIVADKAKPPEPEEWITVRARARTGKRLLVVALQPGDVGLLQSPDQHVLSIETPGCFDEVAIFWDDEATLLLRLARLGFAVGDVQRSGPHARPDRGLS